MIRTRLKKGDQVQVIAGKDKGKQGKILQVFGEQLRVTVEGVAIVKKHQKPRSAKQPGDIIDKNMPISISNVMLVCPQTKLLTRIAYQVLADGSKVRVSKKSGQPIDA